MGRYVTRSCPSEDWVVTGEGVCLVQVGDLPIGPEAIQTVRSCAAKDGLLVL